MKTIQAGEIWWLLRDMNAAIERCAAGEHAAGLDMMRDVRNKFAGHVLEAVSFEPVTVSPGIVRRITP